MALTAHAPLDEPSTIDPRAWERYRQPDGPAKLAVNAALNVVLAHRAVRAFTPEPVPQGVLTTLVAAAQSGPASSNLQVWSVVAVRDPERKGRLAELCGRQAHIVEAPLFLVWLIDFDRLTQLGAGRGVEWSRSGAPPPAGRRCTSCSASSRPTGCISSATTRGFPPSTRMLTGLSSMARSSGR